MVYYNEIDPFAAAWLRELIKANLIANGEVDERDIQDVSPADLAGFTQCHFFAGIGIWSYALRLAGWPDDRPCWTGSCPCQPFSAAGQRKGSADERHLWPTWHHLIRECRPSTIFGEQVASPDALRWLDLVQDDLEGEGYAVGAVDLSAAGVGAPHIRQRLYFLANASKAERGGRSAAGTGPEGLQHTSERGKSGIVAHSCSDERGEGWAGKEDGGPEQSAGCGNALLAGNTFGEGLEGRCLGGDGGDERIAGAAGVAGFWGDAEWLPCRDEKYRPAKRGTFPLVDGNSERVVRGGNSGLPINTEATAEARTMRLKGYGNSIVAPLAAEFIKAYLDLNR